MVRSEPAWSIPHQRNRQTIQTASRTIVLRHLALALGSVDEDDRDLDDAKPALPRPEAHLDLKCVAVGPNLRTNQSLAELIGEST